MLIENMIMAGLGLISPDLIFVFISAYLLSLVKTDLRKVSKQELKNILPLALGVFGLLLIIIYIINFWYFYI